MVNMNVNEARARAESVAVQHYDIALDLDRGDRTFGSTSHLTFESLDGKATFIELAADELESIELNGEELDTALLAGERFPLDPVLGPNVLTVRAVMAYSHDGEGLHRSVDPEDGRAYVYAMTFLDSAPRIFACFDQPDLKATFDLRVRVPDEWTVLGNGRSHREADRPGWWTLATTQRISTYLVTLVAGPYHSLTAEHDGIRLGLHCRQSLAEHLDKDAEELFTTTRECFDEYHRLFGIRYPFGDYAQVFVPEFNAGAMENPGCVTFADEMVFRAQATRSQHSERANVIAHEMAHMWFGDLVTMQWWDDLWLNESFAHYMGHRVCVDATAFTDNWLIFALKGKAWGLDADERSSTHPVAGNGSPDAHSALTNFDGISYAKGAVVLRQLANYLGEEAFVAGITDHLTRHAYGNATLADLVASWERSSGQDLTEWTHAWLRSPGVDTLTVRQGPTTTIERTNGSPEAVSRIHAIKVTAYDATGRATTQPVVITDEITHVDLDSSTPGSFVLADSLDESWVKIRLDDSAIDLLPALLPHITEPTSRAVIWGALRNAMLDARLDPDRWLDMATAVLPAEPDDLVLARVLTECVSRAGTYMHTDDQLSRLESLCERLLVESEGGSNRQLIVARQLLRVTSQVDLLWSWLDGHPPEGLLMDSDMRWRVLEQLCAFGAAGRDEIGRERQEDPSSQGALASLRCAAALPTVAAKADVWATITTDRDISNSDLYALCGSFFRAGQAELVAPYIARYFTQMPGTTSIRNGWVVGLSSHQLFPHFAVDDETIRLAEEVLARVDLDTFFQRSLSDDFDDLQRLRASRQRFGAR